MIEVHSGVDHGNDHVITTGGDVPSFDSIDISVRGARLAGPHCGDPTVGPPGDHSE